MGSTNAEVPHLGPHAPLSPLWQQKPQQQQQQQQQQLARAVLVLLAHPALLAQPQKGELVGGAGAASALPGRLCSKALQGSHHQGSRLGAAVGNHPPQWTTSG